MIGPSVLSEWKANEARQIELRDAFSQGAVQVLKFAKQAAILLKHDAVGAEHILAGVLRWNGGIASDVLKNAGLRLSVLREEIETLRGLGLQQPERQLAQLIMVELNLKIFFWGF